MFIDFTDKVPDRRKCRLCLNSQGMLIYIFEDSGSLKNIAKTIQDVLQYEVTKDDCFPPYVCTDCSNKLCEYKSFKINCDSIKESFDLLLISSEENVVEEQEQRLNCSEGINCKLQLKNSGSANIAKHLGESMEHYKESVSSCQSGSSTLKNPLESHSFLSKLNNSFLNNSHLHNSALISDKDVLGNELLFQYTSNSSVWNYLKLLGNEVNTSRLTAKQQNETQVNGTVQTRFSLPDLDHLGLSYETDTCNTTDDINSHQNKSESLKLSRQEGDVQFLENEEFKSRVYDIAKELNPIHLTNRCSMAQASKDENTTQHSEDKSNTGETSIQVSRTIERVGSGSLSVNVLKRKEGIANVNTSFSEKSSTSETSHKLDISSPISQNNPLSNLPAIKNNDLVSSINLNSSKEYINNSTAVNVLRTDLNPTPILSDNLSSVFMTSTSQIVNNSTMKYQESVLQSLSKNIASLSHIKSNSFDHLSRKDQALEQTSNAKLEESVMDMDLIKIHSEDLIGKIVNRCLDQKEANISSSIYNHQKNLHCSTVNMCNENQLDSSSLDINTGNVSRSCLPDNNSSDLNNVHSVSSDNLEQIKSLVENTFLKNGPKNISMEYGDKFSLEPIQEQEGSVENIETESSSISDNDEIETHCVEETAAPQPNDEHLCEVCGKSFLYIRALRLHMKIHSARMEIKCKECPRVFYMKHHLQQHMSMHLQDRPFKCDICDKRFKMKTHLKQHSLVHSEKLFYQCVHCSLSFRIKWKHDNHQLEHEGEVVWTCMQCKEELKTWAEYQEHLRNHERSKRHVCDICKKSFIDLHALKRHILRHIKPFVCNICQKDFASSDLLKNHVRIHTGEKPYICDICGKACRTRKHLREHKIIHTDEKFKKCTFCANEYRNVKDHIARMHPDCVKKSQ